MAAVALASVADRDVVRCLDCNLTQFPPSNNLCRRCRVPLEPAPEPVPLAMAAPLPAEPVGLAAKIKSVRLRKGFSQSKLAERMSVPRTYVSKIETFKATPTLHSLEKLARGLGVTISELLGGFETKRTDQIRELAKDEFIAKIIPSLPMLSQLQRDGLLIQLRHMATRQQRTA
jgi:transcriptional regulator with XRE-family HTH domain